jgi:aminoglycoside phosphotransferase (APT) family kinase protein
VSDPGTPPPRPPADVLAAAGLPADTAAESAGGATGQLWKVTDVGTTFALRTGGRAALAAHLAAMTAAGRAGLPVPDVVRRGTTPPGAEVVLLSWLPGKTVFDAIRAEPDRAYEIGTLVGAAQHALHDVEAPAQVGSALDAPPTSWPVGGVDGLPPGTSLLHLDWHGLNLLVDGPRISGVLDWDNARSGHPLLDVARTHTLLTVEPTFATLDAAERGMLGALARGWAAGYGPVAADIPPACHAWAGRVMLGDLARRYAANPEALADLDAWTRRWEALATSP